MSIYLCNAIMIEKYFLKTTKKIICMTEEKIKKEKKAISFTETDENGVEHFYISIPRSDNDNDELPF